MNDERAWYQKAETHLNSREGAVVVLRAYTCRVASLARKELLRDGIGTPSAIKIICWQGNHPERETQGYGDRMLIVEV